MLYNPNMRRFLIKSSFSKAKTEVKCDIPFRDFTHVTNKISVLNKVNEIPVYRMIGLDGKLISKPKDKINLELFTKIYEKMIFTEEMDNILLMSKGQGILQNI